MSIILRVISIEIPKKYKIEAPYYALNIWKSRDSL
jgi:hypothetical protein